MATWPETLPQDWLRDGYSERDRDAVIRDEMEQGPDQVRRRSSAVTTDVTASLVLTAEQRATFDTFFRDDLARGALPFLHHRMGRHDEPDVTYRFRSPPAFAVATTNLAPDGDVETFWRVSMELEVLP